MGLAKRQEKSREGNLLCNNVKEKKFEEYPVIYASHRLMFIENLLEKPSLRLNIYYKGESLGSRIGKNLYFQGDADVLFALSMFQVMTERAKIGMVDFDIDNLKLEISDCIACAGMPKVGATLCYFEAGLLAGFLSEALGKKIKVIEEKCWGLGDRFCEFTIIDEKDDLKEIALKIVEELIENEPVVLSLAYSSWTEDDEKKNYTKDFLIDVLERRGILSSKIRKEALQIIMQKLTELL